MASKEILKNLQNKFEDLSDIKIAFKKANNKIADFQKKKELFKNREENNYTFGATVIAVAIIKKNKLFYGVLDDCSISIFNYNLQNRLKLTPHVENSAKYLFSKYSEDDLNRRKFWRKNIRNHKIKFGNKIYGYGVLDGLGNYEPFLQTGEVELKKDDLVCVYSDGFIKPLQDKKFVKKVYPHTKNIVEGVYNSLKSEDLIKYITEYMKINNYCKEKSCYFIKE